MSHRHDTAHGWTYTRTVQIASHTSVNDIDTSDTTDYYLGAFEGYSAEMTYCAELPLAQKVSPNHDLLRKAAKPQSPADLDLSTDLSTSISSYGSNKGSNAMERNGTQWN